MKLRFPLFAKIVLWFFLNLALLGVVFYGFFKAQFRLSLDSLLMGRAGDRIEAVGTVLAAELSDSPREEWNRILNRFSAAYQVQFLLFHGNGMQAAGEPTRLPEPVLEKSRERRGPGGPPPPADRDWPGPPAPPLGPRHQAGGPLPHAKFMLRTSTPTRYWVGTRLPIRDRAGLRPSPMTLLAVSDSVRGGGLFVDLTPWAVVGFGAVLLSLLLWLPLVRGITRSIAQLTRATEQIAAGRFDVRVASRRQDELGSLAQSVNRLAARIEGFVTGQKRFLGDIAHELCSPIARLQMALGILEQRANDREKQHVEDLREEVQHISSLVNELLSFSKAGLRPREVKLEPVNLAALARRLVEREAIPAPQLELRIAEDLCALAEPELLTRALANLLRNALRYAGAAGPITLSAARDDRHLTLTVADSGPGVPAEHLGQIFDPFFRLEASRSRETGGIGLGLAIVKTCVEACQGTVTAHNRQPSGLEVVIRLPVAKSAEGRGAA